MAYIGQKEKAELMPAIKAVLDKYGLKATVAIRHHMDLVITIRAGKIDLVNEYAVLLETYDFVLASAVRREGMFQVHNPKASGFPEKLKTLFCELDKAAKGDKWYDRSDIMTDYFDTAYYITINVGDWRKPYKYLP